MSNETEPNRALVRDVWKALASDAVAAGRVKALIAALATSGAAYVLGGIVIALRLNQARFPVEPSLQVIPLQVLLVTGIRELLLSSVVALVLVAVMLAIGMLPNVSSRAGLVAVPVLLLAVVPLNAGGLAWPAGLSLIGATLWWAQGKRENQDSTWRLPGTRLVIGFLGVVFAITLLRYTVPPYKYPVAELVVKRADAEGRTFPTSGGYVAATSDFVYLAASDLSDKPGDNSYLSAYRRDDVVYMQINPPPKGESTPTTSIVGKLTGSRLAVTPFLDVWIHDRYEGLRLFR